MSQDARGVAVRDDFILLASRRQRVVHSRRAHVVAGSLLNKLPEQNAQVGIRLFNQILSYGDFCNKEIASVDLCQGRFGLNGASGGFIGRRSVPYRDEADARQKRATRNSSAVLVAASSYHRTPISINWFLSAAGGRFVRSDRSRAR